MLILIESIWALMVSSAEMNAEVNKTSLFWLQNSGIRGWILMQLWFCAVEVNVKMWDNKNLIHTGIVLVVPVLQSVECVPNEKLSLVASGISNKFIEANLKCRVEGKKLECSEQPPPAACGSQGKVCKGSLLTLPGHWIRNPRTSRKEY